MCIIILTDLKKEDTGADFCANIFCDGIDERGQEMFRKFLAATAKV